MATAIRDFTTPRETSMTLNSKRLKTLFLAAMGAIIGSAAHAGDAPPTPAAMQAAKIILVASGFTDTLTPLVSKVFSKWDQDIAMSAPEVEIELRPFLAAQGPEFIKTEQG